MPGMQLNGITLTIPSAPCRASSVAFPSVMPASVSKPNTGS